MEIIEQIQEYVVRAKLGEHPQMEFQLGERLLAGSMRKNVWINPNDLCHVDVIVFADDNSVLSLESKANATLGMWEKSMVHLLSSHAASAGPHPRPCITQYANALNTVLRSRP